ncbi:MAG: ligand-binding sensor domain-containing protein [Parvicellaceae bacterium]|jgi:ligand-binding sensor domain-containing protein
MCSSFVGYYSQSWDFYNVTNSAITNDHISELEIDTNGVVWVNASSSLHSFDGANWTTHPYYASDLYLDSQGGMWMLSGQQVYKYDSSNWQLIVNLAIVDPSLTINFTNLAVDGNSQYMYLTGYDSVIYEYGGIVLNKFTAQNSAIPDVSFGTINIAPNGDVWFGCTEHVLVYDGSSFWVTTQIEMGLPPTSIGFSDILFSTNMTFVATVSGLAGLMQFDGVAWTNLGSAGLDLKSKACVVDENQKIWMGSYFDGLVSYDGVNWENFSASNSPFPGYDIWDLEVGPLNKLWLGTWGGGIWVFDPDGVPNSINHYSAQPEITFHQINGEVIFESDIEIQIESVECFDVMGKRIRVRLDHISSTRSIVQIDDLPSGIFILSVKEKRSGRTTNHKFQKTNE